MSAYIISLIESFLELLHRCLLFSNWCYLWLSHMILQSITMHFMPFRRCISL